MNDSGIAGSTGVATTGAVGALAGALGYTEVSFFVWILLGPLSLFIAADLGLSPGEMGILVSLPILTGTLLLLPVGMLADRFGPWRVGMGVHGLLVLALVILVWSARTAGAGLFLGAALLGLGGVSFAVALPLVSACFTVEHQGKALGLTAFGGTGALLAAFLAPVLAETYDWRTVLLVALGVVLCSWGLFAWTGRGVAPLRSRLTWPHYLSVLRYADTFWFCLFYAVTFGGMVSLSSFLVGYFHDQFHLPPTTAGVLATLSILAGALFRPVGGWLADRRGGIRTLQTAFIAVTIGALLLSFTPVRGLSVIGLVLVMTAFGGGNGALFQLLPIRFRNHMGVIVGLVGTAGGLGGFLFVFAAAGLQRHLGAYQPAFLFYGALSLLALAGLSTVKRRWRTTWGAPQVTTARV